MNFAVNIDIREPVTFPTARQAVVYAFKELEQLKQVGEVTIWRSEAESGVTTPEAIAFAFDFNEELQEIADDLLKVEKEIVLQNVSWDETGKVNLGEIATIEKLD